MRSKTCCSCPVQACKLQSVSTTKLGTVHDNDRTIRYERIKSSFTEKRRSFWICTKDFLALVSNSSGTVNLSPGHEYWASKARAGTTLSLNVI
jgi:hypothetical protein